MSEQPTNSVLEVKLDYVIKDISVIKGDIKDIKNDYITRREFNDALKALRDEIKPLRQFVYAIIGVIGVSVLGAILNQVITK